MAANEPLGLLDEVENILPDEWREQIVAFPLTAMALGLGVGVWIGMTKSDEILSEGKTLLSGVVMSNVQQIFESFRQ